jgi:CHAD domain-containing protein
MCMRKNAAQRIAEAAREPEIQRTAAAAAALTGAAATAGKLVSDRTRRRRRNERRFRLRSAEPLDEGVRRVARGRVDDALDHLEGRTREDGATAVHEARKSLKRARALVRLGRDALGDAAYRRENAAYRAAGRRLAAARDAEVVVQTLDDVTERYADELHPNGDAALHERLEREREAARVALEEGGNERDATVAALEHGRARIAAWQLEDDIAPLTRGLRRIYRRGRRRMRDARKDPSVEALHEWRKRVKDLWHAYELLRPARPKEMKRRAKDVHRLADLLGEDHDLAVLRERARGADLRAVIDRRRGELRDEAFALGERVYARKPGAVARRVEKRWRRRAAAAA